MAVTITPYAVADIAALQALTGLPASGSGLYYARFVNGIGWYNFDPDATTGGIAPTVGTGRWFPVSSDVLRANRIYYVRTDGNDSNTGLANNSGGAFLTWQKAFNVIGTLVLNGFTVTAKQGNTGTLAGGTVKTALGDGTIIVEGDTTTPSNCVMSSALSVQDCNSNVEVKGIRFTGTFNGEAGSALTVVNNKSLSITGNCQFANTVGRHIYCLNGVLNINSSYSISGGGVCHFLAFIGGKIINAVTGLTITVSGTPAFSVSFALADRLAIINIPSVYVAFSGSATGQRYISNSNAVINTGGGANYFPGNVAGSTDGFGVYS